MLSLNICLLVIFRDACSNKDFKILFYKVVSFLQKSVQESVFTLHFINHCIYKIFNTLVVKGCIQFQQHTFLPRTNKNS